MKYYLAIKRNEFESAELRWINLEPVIQSKVSQKEKYHKLKHTHTHTQKWVEDLNRHFP